MKIKRRYKLFFLLLLLVTINVAVCFFDYRIEPNKQDVYKLDDASLEIVKNLDDDIIITFYKSDNLTPSLQHFSDKILSVLKAYQKVAKVQILIDFINPSESLDVELEATNAGINSIEKRDENKLKKMFLGMIVQQGERTEVLPTLLPQMSVEYLISSTFRKMEERHRRKIGVVQGQGEPPLSKMQAIQKRLAPNYDLEVLRLSDSLPISEYESLLIIAPSSPFKDEEFEILDLFLRKGKNIFLALDRVEYDAEENEAYEVNSHVEEWLIRKGLIIYTDFVVDNSCSDVRMDEFTPPTSFPYFPQITNFIKHPVTQGVNTVVLRYASSIEFVNKQRVKFIPLARSSEVSGKKSLPFRIDLGKKWTKSDYLYPNQVVAAIIEGALVENANEESKIAVISDGDLVQGFSNDKRFDDNYLFVTNIIDWLSDSSGLASLKQKGVREAKGEEVQVGLFRKYLNLLFPLCCVGLFALFSHYRKKRHIDKLRTSTF